LEILFQITKCEHGIYVMSQYAKRKLKNTSIKIFTSKEWAKRRWVWRVSLYRRIKRTSWTLCQKTGN